MIITIKNSTPTMMSEIMKNMLFDQLNTSLSRFIKLSNKHKTVTSIYMYIKYSTNVIFGLGGNYALITGVKAI